MVDSPLLDELRERLVGALGDGLHGVVLFGSETCGESGPESGGDSPLLREVRRTGVAA